MSTVMDIPNARFEVFTAARIRVLLGCDEV